MCGWRSGAVHGPTRKVTRSSDRVLTVRDTFARLRADANAAQEDITCCAPSCSQRRSAPSGSSPPGRPRSPRTPRRARKPLSSAAPATRSDRPRRTGSGRFSTASSGGGNLPRLPVFRRQQELGHHLDAGHARQVPRLAADGRAAHQDDLPRHPGRAEAEGRHRLPRAVRAGRPEEAVAPAPQTAPAVGAVPVVRLSCAKLGRSMMKVRAAVAREAGKPLSLETVDLEGPHAGEVLVEIKATGICHTDEFTLSGADPEGIFPSILGHEGAGVVAEVGAGVTSLKKGDHVIPLYTPECRQCEYCLSRKSNLCVAIRATQGKGVMPDDTSR